MLVYAEIVHIYFFKNVIFSFKARRGLQRQNSCLQNSAQCKSLLDIKKFNSLTPRNTARSLTPGSVSQFWIFKRFSKIFRKINIWTLDSLKMEMFESKTKFVWLCTVLISKFWISANLIFWLCAVFINMSPTPSSVSVSKVRLCAVLVSAESDSEQC